MTNDTALHAAGIAMCFAGGNAISKGMWSMGTAMIVVGVCLLSINL